MTDNQYDNPRRDPATGRTNYLDVKAHQTLNTAAAYAAINKRPDKRDDQRRKP